MGVLAATERTERAPLAPERYDWLHRQAELQVQSRDSGRPVHRHLEPKRAAGYALLPQPRSGGWPHLDPREREMLGNASDSSAGSTSRTIGRGFAPFRS